MGRIHLMEQDAPKCFYVLEEGVDHIGAMKDGLVKIGHAEDIAQADSTSALLLLLQEREPSDCLFFVESDFIDSKKRTRLEIYPQHRNLHVLTGLIQEVLSPHTEEPYTVEWIVRYISALWVELNTHEIIKVLGFTEKAKAEAEAYLKEKGLVYEAD